MTKSFPSVVLWRSASLLLFCRSRPLAYAATYDPETTYDPEKIMLAEGILDHVEKRLKEFRNEMKAPTNNVARERLTRSA